MELPNPPRLSVTEAITVLRRLYGINRPCRLKPLESYDDQNYMVHVINAPAQTTADAPLSSTLPTASTSPIPHTSDQNGVDGDSLPIVQRVSADDSGGKYVLKIINSATSTGALRRLNEQQAVCRELLRQQGLPCCRTIPTVDGTLLGSYNSATDSGTVEPQNWRGSHTVELHEFLPGVALRYFPDLRTTPAVFVQVGKLVGQVRKVWAVLPHDQFPPNTTPFWNISRGPEVRPLMQKLCAKDVDDKLAFKAKGRDLLVQQVIQNFQYEMASRQAHLHVSVIHGDINDNNVLLIDDGENGPVVSGLLDFADCCVSYAVLDIALTMTYMMLMCIDSDDEHHGVHENERPRNTEAIDAAGLTLAGYLQASTLNEEELRLLPHATAMRLVQSLVISAYTYTFLQPDNEYLLQTAESGWCALKLITELGTQEVLRRWNDVVQKLD